MARLTIEHDAPAEDANAKTRRRSIALRLDGHAWLRVEREVFAELGIHDCDDFDNVRRAEIELTIAQVRARLFVIRSLAVRMQSTAELERKLAARDIPADVARDALERVADYGYVNDEALANQLARGMRSRGYGRRRAEQKLRERGLTGDIAKAAIAEAYEQVDETDLATEALRNRPTATDAERRRAVAFLSRRGFSTAAAWGAVRASVETEGS